MTKRKSTKPTAEKAVRDIRRATRHKYSAEEKIRIVMEGLRAEESLILKEALAELLMENRLLKKSMLGDVEDDI